MKRLTILAFLLVLPACSILPWHQTSGDLSQDVRMQQACVTASRGEVEASSRLSVVERANLIGTLDKADADLFEARNLLSLEAPPADRVKAYIASAGARCYSVQTYLEGV